MYHLGLTNKHIIICEQSLLSTNCLLNIPDMATTLIVVYLLCFLLITFIERWSGIFMGCQNLLSSFLETGCLCLSINDKMIKFEYV